MILDNGVIRTLDQSRPTAGALAIAGPIIAGGVGTHEWMLPTPERVDLAGLHDQVCGVHVSSLCRAEREESRRRRVGA